MYLAGVDANIYCGTVDLLPGYPFNVDNPFLSVNSNHLALSALQSPISTNELDVKTLQHIQCQQTFLLRSSCVTQSAL